MAVKKVKQAAQGKAKEWQVEWLEINSLNPYENNARKNDATIPYLKNSIQRFGFRVPLVIGKGNVVVCGHTRLIAALELGMEKLPCVRADDLTDAELKAFRLADNKVQELSGWDFEKLDAEMKQLKIDFDGDMVDFGFGDSGFEDSEIDGLDEDGMGADNFDSDNSRFSATFIFPIEFKSEFDRFVKENKKDKVVEIIMRGIRNGD